MLTAIWGFLFHRHKWEVIGTGPLKAGRYYILKCKKCGKSEVKDF
jgi:hypothetical protein